MGVLFRGVLFRNIVGVVSCAGLGMAGDLVGVLVVCVVQGCVYNRCGCVV